MTKKMLAVIIARGGSKGIPAKNIALVNGLPLIYWTIQAALNSTYIDKVIVSSDNATIINTARNLGCVNIVNRPDSLSGDDIPSVDVVLHALKEFPNYDYVIMLQPTSPLRDSNDIDSAFLEMVNMNAKSIVSVCKTEDSPYWTYTINKQGALVNVVEAPENAFRRQNLPDTYILNGALYIANTDFLIANKSFLSNDTAAFVMSREKSLDIDTLEDLEIFTRILKAANK